MSAYVSHPVRRIREEPVAGESVGLVVELAEADPEGFASRVEALGGEVERELPFRSYLVRIPETAVAALCDLPGLERVETANTLSIAGDVAAERPKNE